MSRPENDDEKITKLRRKARIAQLEVERSRQGGKVPSRQQLLKFDREVMRFDQIERVVDHGGLEQV